MLLYYFFYCLIVKLNTVLKKKEYKKKCHTVLKELRNVYLFALGIDHTAKKLIWLKKYEMKRQKKSWNLATNCVCFIIKVIVKKKEKKSYDIRGSTFKCHYHIYRYTHIYKIDMYFSIMMKWQIISLMFLSGLFFTLNCSVIWNLIDFCMLWYYTS